MFRMGLNLIVLNSYQIVMGKKIEGETLSY